MQHSNEAPIVRTLNNVYSPVAAPRRGGRLEIHPAFGAKFAALGLTSAAAFLDLPGEVVSGHPDRHVVRVQLSGFPNAFYLKRQHSVTRRERLRNWLAGFGWSSRCDREAACLKQLSHLRLPCPRWAAVGMDEKGRAFLLVEELPGGVDLRHVLRDRGTSPSDRRWLADHLGGSIALLHAAGFTTPDLTAKHVLVSLGFDELAVIDWQSARRVKAVSLVDRLRTLGALHASVGEGLATTRERLRVLWAALRPARKAGLLPGRFSQLARLVTFEARRFAHRRSIRDQLQGSASTSQQRLVWVAGEAVCARPDVAAIWPVPAIAPPFYGCKPGAFWIRLPDGREATLIRGRSFAPLGRLRSWLRGRSWRSPGVTLGRVLFHLERYGVPAPRLLGFGQRLTGVASAEWFALHEPAVGPVPHNPESSTAELLGRTLRLLHDAGCRVSGDPLAAFGLGLQGVAVRNVQPIRIVRHLSNHDRVGELGRLAEGLASPLREAVAAGYYSAPRADKRSHTDRGVAPSLKLVEERLSAPHD